jgi:hypothetical protein
VLKSVSFDLIEDLLPQRSWGEVRARPACLSPADAGTSGERVGWNGVPIDDEELIYPLGRLTAF